jgi:prefoldin subunit 5
MNVQERIDLLNDALAKVQSAIAKTNTALGTAVALGDNQSLASQLTDLHAEQESLRTRIANLQMAAPTIGFIAPEAAVRLSALGGELDRIIVRDATVSAVLDFGSAVLAKVSALRQAA